MAQNVNIPYFPTPPAAYSQQYFAEVTRAFSLFAEQSRVPGPLQASTLVLTNLPVFADNATALSGGLALGTVYRTATGELRIVV